MHFVIFERLVIEGERGFMGDQRCLHHPLACLVNWHPGDRVNENKWRIPGRQLISSIKFLVECRHRSVFRGVLDGIREVIAVGPRT